VPIARVTRRIHLPAPAARLSGAPVVATLQQALEAIGREARSVGCHQGLLEAISAACQPLIGWLLDRSWTGETIEGARVYGTGAYHVAFLTLVACAVVALASAISLTETHGRQADS
jgi:hypothetical protein